MPPHFFFAAYVLWTPKGKNRFGARIHSRPAPYPVTHHWPGTDDSTVTTLPRGERSELRSRDKYGEGKDVLTRAEVGSNRLVGGAVQAENNRGGIRHHHVSQPTYHLGIRHQVQNIVSRAPI